ncbi:MAG: von Willebrand factor type [Anaerocolumna sp.]|nr:von Willebrand factor type [Anaerocolumna sp.]
MKKNVLRYISLILIITVFVTGLYGCSSKKETNFYNEPIDTIAEAESFEVNKESNNSTAMEYDMEQESPMMDQLTVMDGGELQADSFTNENGMEEFNTEEYNAIIENNFQAVKDYPLSTFSVDVDTASYSNIRRMIYDEGVVEPDAVRIEEMINYFKYDYEKSTGDTPFSINTELSNCPWNEDAKLLLIGLQAKEIDLTNRPSSNLVFLLDISGSMEEPDKLPLVQKAFTMLAENLNENDRISIVTYAGFEQVVLEGARGDDKYKITEAINNLTAGGSTAGAAGITKAYELAENYFLDGGNNRVILATDGDLNVGVSSEGELTRLIEKKRKKGVFLSVLGFGTENIKDNKMEALADNGNGNYAYIDSLLEAKKVLVEEMGGTLFTVAKDVKLQVEFNPTKVKGYRLIGYENRMLNTEDFNDDTKDAGEIGAGHRVTALYEIVEVGSKQEIAESNLKYQQQTATSDTDEWLTINIRYKEPDEDTSKLITKTVDQDNYVKVMPKNLSFASSVAAFGMILRDSKWKGTANYDMVIRNVDKLNLQGDEYKDEFLSLVKKMERSNSTWILD